MYESFFALKEKPFSLTPNPRFLFLSKTHNEVYAHLIYGIENRAGFVEVTGEVGTGKTTILRTLLSHLDEKKYRVAFIFNPKLTAFELLKNINQEFGIADDGQNIPDLIKTLNEFLIAENRLGRTPILVIDEAQNLSGEVLEQIRLLSNLETEEDKLIQVILVGQPELRQHLNDYSLRQLNQRIAVRYQLRPLNIDETGSYILHRLKIAGRPDSNVFSAAAIKRVYKLSGGVPRRINLLCDRAMLTAFTEERGAVSVKDVNQAAAELEGLGEDRSGRGLMISWKPLAIAVFLIACLVVLTVALVRPPGTSEDVAISPVQDTSPAPPVSPKKPTAAKSDAETIQSGPASIVASTNALLDMWGANLLTETTAEKGLDIEREFADRGFRVISLAGDIDAVAKFKLPFLLPVSQQKGGGYIAVTRPLSSDRWAIAPPFRGNVSLSSGELNQLGMQMAIVPWIDFADIGYVAVPGVKGENVRRLQFLLGLSGCPDVPTDGHFDRRTIACVKQFQSDQGLVVDGLVGPRTLILLYQRAGAYDMPLFS